MLCLEIISENGGIVSVKDKRVHRGASLPKNRAMKQRDTFQIVTLISFEPPEKKNGKICREKNRSTFIMTLNMYGLIIEMYGRLKREVLI